MEIQYYPSIPSTNTAALEMSKKGAKSWTVLWTTEQTQGRGYAGNKWLTQKGENLAFSMLIINELAYDELTFFNQWVSNSICEFLQEFAKEVSVKWPNDIMVGNKKVCGILIETYKSDNQMHIVTGVGLNINQTQFENLDKAGSLAGETHQNYDIEEILSGILTKLKKSYFQIQNKNWEDILENYNSNLFLKGVQSTFKAENLPFQGIVQFVDSSGKIHIKTQDGSVKSFINKQIEFIF